MLTEFNTLVAAWLSARPAFPMLFFDSLSVGTIVVIVIYVAMFWWIFLRIRMIRSNFCHWQASLWKKLSAASIFPINLPYQAIVFLGAETGT